MIVHQHTAVFMCGEGQIAAVRPIGHRGFFHFISIPNDHFHSRAKRCGKPCGAMPSELVGRLLKERLVVADAARDEY